MRVPVLTGQALVQSPVTDPARTDKVGCGPLEPHPPVVHEVRAVPVMPRPVAVGARAVVAKPWHAAELVETPWRARLVERRAPRRLGSGVLAVDQQLREHALSVTDRLSAPTYSLLLPGRQRRVLAIRLRVHDHREERLSLI